MDDNSAKMLIKGTFNYPFDEGRFRNFAINLFEVDESKGFSYISGNYIRHSFINHITKYRRLGTYIDPDSKKIDVLVVQLKNEWALVRSRAMLRNFTADYLKNRNEKDAALVAYYTTNPDDWRFSYIRMEYKREQTETGAYRIRQDVTPAKRYSFLVGKNEPNHTAQEQLVGILEDDRKNPTLAELESAFSVEAVSRQFYTDYRRLYEKLKEELDSIVENDSKISSEFAAKSVSTSNFAKKTMGQIVFLYFLQKKGWLGVGKNEDGNFLPWGKGPRDFLRKLFEREFVDYSNFFNDVLEPLFYAGLASEHDDDYFPFLKRKVPFLNGGLFEPMNKYNWQETDILISNEILKDVLDTFDRYNFTVREDEPLEKEVAVDPEMLGKVFENLIDENERKGQGAYYTPRTIVHYMCQESLINYLSTACEAVPKEDIETLIREGEIILELETAIEEDGKKYKSVLMESIKDNAKVLDKSLAQIKVCDPAIGSGAFPVGMLTEIVKARKVLELYLGHKRSVYELKRHCIQNSLYGVDIDSGAIEIAKLRLWLSLVVDEDDYTSIQPLPNLDYKIMQGNSLIEEFHGISLDIEKKTEPQADMFSGGSDLDLLVDDLHRKQDDFFNAEHPGEKSKKRKHVETAIFNIFHHELDKQQNVSPEVTHAIETDLKEMTHGNKIRNFFPWKLYFADVFRDKGGFDVVIANPPYIQLQKALDDGTDKKYADLYKECGYETFKRTGDIYALFYEQGINVLKDVGHLTYITSNKWMRAGYGDVLRGFFVKLNPKILLDFGGFRVFESATVDVNILISEKADNQYSLQAAQFRNDFQKGDSVADYFEQNKIEMNSSSSPLTDDTWFIGSPAEIALKQKIEEIGTPLKDWDVKIYRGVLTGYNTAFIIDETKRAKLIAQDPKSEEIIKPILRGRDIKRYGYEFAGLYLIATLPALNLNIDDYPAVRDYLKSFGKRLHQTGETFFDEKGNSVKSRKRTGNKWFETQDQIVYYPEFAKEKVVWKRIGSKLRFSFDASGSLALDSNCIMTGEKTKFLTALLNSKVGLHLLQDSPKTGTGDLIISVQAIDPILVPQIKPTNRHLAKQIEALVELRIKNEELGITIKTNAEIENEIDQLVYELYGLTEEEITIVEESVN